MYNGEVIRDLLASRGKKIQDLRDGLGYKGNTSIYQIIEGNPSANILEKVADYFRVSMDTFFIRDVKLTTDDDVEYYKKILAEKDARIEVLEKYIKVLEERQIK